MQAVDWQLLGRAECRTGSGTNGSKRRGCCRREFCAACPCRRDSISRGPCASCATMWRIACPTSHTCASTRSRHFRPDPPPRSPWPAGQAHAPAFRERRRSSRAAAGRTWTLERLYEGDREMLYILTFYLPRFLDHSFREKLITVFHELYHISPELRRRHSADGRPLSRPHAQPAANTTGRWIARRRVSPPLAAGGTGRLPQAQFPRPVRRRRRGRQAAPDAEIDRTARGKIGLAREHAGAEARLEEGELSCIAPVRHEAPTKTRRPSSRRNRFESEILTSQRRRIFEHSRFFAIVASGEFAKRLMTTGLRPWAEASLFLRCRNGKNPDPRPSHRKTRKLEAAESSHTSPGAAAEARRRIATSPCAAGPQKLTGGWRARRSALAFVVFGLRDFRVRGRVAAFESEHPPDSAFDELEEPLVGPRGLVVPEIRVENFSLPQSLTQRRRHVRIFGSLCR